MTAPRRHEDHRDRPRRRIRHALRRRDTEAVSPARWQAARAAGRRAVPLRRARFARRRFRSRRCCCRSISQSNEDRVKFVAGGATRLLSVARGLEYAGDADADRGARRGAAILRDRHVPRLSAAAEEHGAALPVVPLSRHGTRRRRGPDHLDARPLHRSPPRRRRSVSAPRCCATSSRVHRAEGGRRDR